MTPSNAGRAKLMKAIEKRIADRSVLHLIRVWLTTPIIEKDEQGQMTKTRPHQGTPQGGVISPLLANLFLHWFDKVFHGKEGPGTFANARLIRYADDFVIMARYIGDRIENWVEGKLETWMGVMIGRLNQFLIGWSNYFGHGHPSHAFRTINGYVQIRMNRFLRRRSQRPFRPPKGVSWYSLIYDKLQVVQLRKRSPRKP